MFSVTRSAPNPTHMWHATTPSCEAAGNAQCRLFVCLFVCVCVGGKPARSPPWKGPTKGAGGDIRHAGPCDKPTWAGPNKPICTGVSYLPGHIQPAFCVEKISSNLLHCCSVGRFHLTQVPLPRAEHAAHRWLLLYRTNVRMMVSGSRRNFHVEVCCKARPGCH